MKKETTHTKRKVLWAEGWQRQRPHKRHAWHVWRGSRRPVWLEWNEWENGGRWVPKVSQDCSVHGKKDKIHWWIIFSHKNNTILRKNLEDMKPNVKNNQNTYKENYFNYVYVYGKEPWNKYAKRYQEFWMVKRKRVLFCSRAAKFAKILCKERKIVIIERICLKKKCTSMHSK